MTGIRNYGVEINAKILRQLDALEVVADGVGGGSILGMVFMSSDWPVVFIERMRSSASSLVGAAIAAAQLIASKALRVRQGIFMARTSGHRRVGRSSCCYGVPGDELRTGHAASCLLQRSGRLAIYHLRCPAVQLSPGAAKGP